MSDVHVRELERRWLSTRAVADEVALVHGRLRAGAITRERVELAAYCGRPAAIEVLGKPIVSSFPAGLHRFDASALPRLVVAWIRQLLPLFGDRTCEDLVAAVEEQLACPCSMHASQVARLRSAVPERPVEQDLLSCARALAEPFTVTDPEPGASLQLFNALVTLLAEFHGDGSALASATDEVVCWALAHDDLLAARVNERAARRERAEHTEAPPLVASPDAAAALKAAEARAKVRPRDLPTLVDLVHRSEQAGWTLDGRPISELRAALADPSGSLDDDRRLAALLAPLGPRAVPLGLDAIQRHGSRAAFLLLETLGPAAAAAVPAMLELLAHADGSIRIRAAQVLATIGKPAVMPLRLRLPELSHPGAAVFALLALGEGPWPLEAPLLHAFNQNDESVWSLLFELRPTRRLAPAAPALRALVASPLSTPAVRARCEAILREL